MEAIAVGATNRIVEAGDDGGLLAVRLDTDGLSDSRFGTSGVVTGTGANAIMESALQSNGQLVICTLYADEDDT